MADTLGCANLINRHPIHEIHPHPAELRIRQVLPNLRDLSDAAVDLNGTRYFSRETAFPLTWLEESFSSVMAPSR